MELKMLSFPSGIRMVFCEDTDNFVVTDIETESMRAEFIYLGKGDSIDNYKPIDRNTPLPEHLETDDVIDLAISKN